MRHKWLSEKRKLQCMDQLLMAEEWKQSKPGMKGERRSPRRARLAAGGPRCFEAKDTTRRVFRRWWGASGKETEIQPQARDKGHKAQQWQGPKGARAPRAQREMPPQQGAQPWLVGTRRATGVSAGRPVGLMVGKRQTRAGAGRNAGFRAAVRQSERGRFERVGMHHASGRGDTSSLGASTRSPAVHPLSPVAAAACREA